MNPLLQESKLLDYNSPVIRSLIRERKWDALDDFHKIKQIYNFVRDEIRFEYNVDDAIPASKVLKDGYGQCNTKGTLFMALLRGVGIPCRIHGFTIDKKLQKGAMTGFVYANAPKDIFHSWVEVLYQDNWYELEAFILDIEYLTKLQEMNANHTGAFFGYGVAVSDFQDPVIEWNANHTYIQSEGITRNLGIYNSPDELLLEHHQELSLLKMILFRYVGRHLMNRNVTRIRHSRAQENSGHATASFTLDTYGHVTEKMKKDSADRMQAFIKSVS